MDLNQRPLGYEERCVITTTYKTRVALESLVRNRRESLLDSYWTVVLPDPMTVGVAPDYGCMRSFNSRRSDAAASEIRQKRMSPDCHETQLYPWRNPELSELNSFSR